MPKKPTDPHAGIKYYRVRKGSEPGCYQLHTPRKCRLKDPVTKQYIHKLTLPQLQTMTVHQAGIGTGVRNLIVPRPGKNYYPAVMPKPEYERLRSQARIVAQEEILEGMRAQEEAIQRAAKESEARKEMLNQMQLPQPGALAADTADAELEGPDQTEHTLTRAEMLKADAMLGPRLANGIILASKCHAIRDAQLVEKELIKKELDEETKRLDQMMEENRLAAVRRAEEEERRRKELRLQNLAALKEQIHSHHTEKIMALERREEESIRINQASIALQADEAARLREKHQRQARLKEILDQGNAELLYYKQMQMEEERIMGKRIEEFLKAKHEREMRNQAEQNAIKAAKQKGIDHIATAQKKEQELKDELERIRNLKIAEDVERAYRRKERDAALKRSRELKSLHEARVNQINDIHRMIAREIAKDEQSFNNDARKNEEFLRKEKELENERKKRIEAHRRAIMQQINDKERARAEIRSKIHNEGVAIRLEQQQQDKYERMIIRNKVQQLREQKVPEKYVKEVEQTLAKHGYKVE